MPLKKKRKQSNSQPKLCRHKHRNQGYVRVKGRQYYFGPWGPDPETPSAECQQRYHSFLAERAVSGFESPSPNVTDLTVSEALEKFLEYARGYYAGGESSGHYTRIRAVVLATVDLYGATPAREFGPLKLRAVQAELIERGYCRANINSMLGCLKLGFKWLASHELIDGSIPVNLATVPGLRRGKTEAKEHPPVAPVEAADFEETIKHLSPTVAAMIRVQLLCGCRPGEIVGLRPRDFDTSGEVWTAKLSAHRSVQQLRLDPILHPRYNTLATLVAPTGVAA